MDTTRGVVIVVDSHNDGGGVVHVRVDKAKPSVPMLTLNIPIRAVWLRYGSLHPPQYSFYHFSV